MATKDLLMNQGRMLKAAEVASMWGVSKRFLWKITHSKRDPLPSYKVGKCRLYKFDEIMYYMDNHKSTQ